LTPASGAEIYRFPGRRPGNAMPLPKEGTMHMTAGQTGYTDATYDLIAVRYYALKAAITPSMPVRPKTPGWTTSRSFSATP
jgi:hypothetical protein